MDLDIDRGTFGPVLKRVRLAAGLSQEQLAERANLSVESISALERGRRRAPYRETIKQLADALGVSASQRLELIAAAQRSPSQPSVRFETSGGHERVGLAASPDVTAQPSMPWAIPERATPLVGRSADIAALTRLTQRARVITIIGSGGIGKTSTAIELGRHLNATTGMMINFIDLAPIEDATLVASTIGASFGAVGTDVQDAASIVQAIGRAAAFIIIDNCEHVRVEVARIVDVLVARCANIRIIATSREPLGVGGEFTYRLPPLTVPPKANAYDRTTLETFSAVALFIERAAAAGAASIHGADTLATIVEICRQLDGIPLAIELATARVRIMTVDELRSTLHATLALPGASQRAAGARQSTVRAVIDWSVRLLEPAEGALFSRLGVFPGTWTLEASRAVCRDESADLGAFDALLFALVEKSLVVSSVEHNTTRFRLLEVARAYANDRLNDAERRELRRRHAHWVAEMTTAARKSYWHWSEQQWLTVISPETENVRLALTTELADASGRSAAARIAANVARLWYEGGLQAEGRRWIEAIVNSWEADAQPDLLGQLWYAKALLSSGNRIVEACRSALLLLDARRQPDEVIDVYVRLGFGYWQSGRLDEALSATDAAIELLMETGTRTSRRIANILDLRGSIFLSRGEFVEARTMFTEAHDIFRILDDEHGMARTQGNLAELAFASGDTARALDLVDGAAQIFVKLGFASRLATCRINAAAYQLMLGDVDAACAAATEGLALARDSQDTALVAIAVQQLATVLAQRGDARGAALLLGYVNAWYDAEGYQRERNEQQILELLEKLILRSLSEREYNDLLIHGSHLTQDEATAAAQRLLDLD